MIISKLPVTVAVTPSLLRATSDTLRTTPSPSYTLSIHLPNIFRPRCIQVRVHSEVCLSAHQLVIRILAAVNHPPWGADRVEEVVQSCWLMHVHQDQDLRQCAGEQLELQVRAGSVLDRLGEGEARIIGNEIEVKDALYVIPVGV
jgi:hypothetical protein